MAETDPKNRAAELNEDPDTDRDNIRDEETIIPDPEQVERDRKKSEEIYNEEEPAA